MNFTLGIIDVLEACSSTGAQIDIFDFNDSKVCYCIWNPVHELCMPHFLVRHYFLPVPFMDIHGNLGIKDGIYFADYDIRIENVFVIKK